MKRFRIFYFGMICHVGDSPNVKRHAAIIRDNKHRPVIAFDAANFHELGKDAERVTFDRLGDADADTNLLFNMYVPSLESIMGGQLRANLTAHAILVDYPINDKRSSRRGILSVDDLYDGQAIYRRLGVTRHNGCVARLTVLTVDTRTETTDVIVKRKDAEDLVIGRDIATDSVVLVANISGRAIEIFRREKFDEKTREADSEDESAHVQRYETILQGPGTINLTKVTPPRGEECVLTSSAPTWIEDFIRALMRAGIRESLEVECGNTDWP